MTGAPALSVVVACSPGSAPAAVAGCARPWLDALQRSCAGLAAELVIVGPSWAEPVASRDLVVSQIAAPVDSLVPVRWGLGLAAARGDVVAFTTDRCAVRPGWARAALDGVNRGAAAVGGPIVPGAELTRTDRAIFQLRFGALPRSPGGCIAVPDVAADNAAYDRAILLRVGQSWTAGFWEVEANRRLRASRYSLLFCPEMEAEFTGGEPLWPLAAQRFVHGRHAGAWRTATRARARWQVVVAAPLVPPLLLARALQRSRARGQPLAPLLGIAPEFLVLATAWAAGELVGAARPPHGLHRDPRAS